MPPNGNYLALKNLYGFEQKRKMYLVGVTEQSDFIILLISNTSLYLLKSKD